MLTIRILLLSALAGLAGARLGYGLLHPDYYLAAPLELLKLWKDGFLVPAGAVASVLSIVLLVRRRGCRPRAAAVPLLAVLAAWGSLHGLTRSLEARPELQLPPLRLQSLDGVPVALEDWRGRPLAVNLWASWCPPCRQEMPAMEAAQARFPDIHFLFVNQGEDAETIARYLDEEALSLSHVLLDPSSSASQALKAAALPTTLFFDSEGRLAGSWTGELTTPRLRDFLRRLRSRHREL